LDLTAEKWQIYIRFWQGMGQVGLYEQVQELLCRAVCAWAGVPLQEQEVKKRAQDLAALVGTFGAVGPRHWRARRRVKIWIMKLIRRIREDKLSVPEGTAAQVISSHRDLKGNLLDKHTAAVELINILRPTVAIDRFITFAAVALHQHPPYQARLQAGEEALVEMFVQEVHRYFPYAPFLAALVRRDFSWQGYFFPKGRLVLLDLYGTNHDSRLWEQPYEFRPERFSTRNGSPFNFMPPGGGDYYTGHQCAGEWITIEQMKLAVRMLTREMVYQVPRQDLSISLRRIPAMPKSRFIIRQVHAVG
jgi:fatty-acid peroxygenase